MNIVNMSDAPYKYPSLTGDMLFRLWNAAIKDDDTLADEMIRGSTNACWPSIVSVRSMRWI